jgi:DNA mismatch repair protein MutS2
MTPTFELAVGVPGSSSALAVARRYGMPGAVLERAERFLTREDQSFEAMVQKLHDERAALELARNAAEEREGEARRARSQLTAEIEAARSREKRFLGEEAADLVERIRQARDELREARARLRARKADADAIREAERAVDRVAREVAIGGPLERLVASVDDGPAGVVREPELRKGARVWVPRLRAEAEVVDILGDGSVRVAAGSLKLTVPSSELRAPAPVEPAPRPAPRSARARRGGARAAPEAPPSDAPAIQTRDNTCDVRGLRVDDAVGMAMTFIDRAIGSGQPAVFVLHGHGTGALREAIRKELARSRYVASFRSGAPDQGGDGVTLVSIA